MAAALLEWQVILRNCAMLCVVVFKIEIDRLVMYIITALQKNIVIHFDGVVGESEKGNPG